MLKDAVLRHWGIPPVAIGGPKESWMGPSIEKKISKTAYKPEKPVYPIYASMDHRREPEASTRSEEKTRF